MISIGRLRRGDDSVTYYLVRQADCDLAYYTGAGERPGRWLGRGARALGLTQDLDAAGAELLRGLAAGRGPDGTLLVPPVLRADPRGALPAGPLVTAVRAAAELAGVEPAVLIGDGRLAVTFGRAADALDSGRRPSMLRADVAGRIAVRAGVDPRGLWRDHDGTDGYPAALPFATAMVDVRRVGLDVTFSAPKSVSVLFGLGSPDIVAAVRAAHETALADALGYLETVAARAARGHHGDGRQVPRIGTDGLIAVAFEHRTSRAGDPQLHTHVVIPNLCRGVDGRWSALDTAALYREATTASYLYQAVLRGELTRTLGVGWTPVVRGIAEVDGIPRKVLRGFSKRRAQIERALDESGRSGHRATHTACLATRPAKQHQPPHRLRDGWAAEARAHGLDPADLTGVTGRLAPPALPGPDGLAARVFATDGVTEHASTFDRGALLRTICQQLPAGAQLRAALVRDMTNTMLRRPEVVRMLTADQPTYSTVELLHTEQRALAAVRERAADALAVVPTPELRGLRREQAVMVAALTSSGRGVDVVAGPAGAGKTRALARATQAWQQAGIPVRGTALAAIAARGVADATGMPAVSLARLRRNPAEHIPTGGVLVVDEAGMVGTRALAQLVEQTRAARCKLVLVGDPAQLPEIEAGGLFAALAAQRDAVRLAGNQRQHATWERAALASLRRGDVDTALDLYRDHERIRTADTPAQLRSRIVEDYLAARSSAADPDRVAILALRRADAETLNAAVRQQLRDAGALGTDACRVDTKQGERDYRVGDRVVVTRNDYSLGLLNGSRGQVAAVHEDGLTLRTERGHVRVGRDWLAAGRLDHGYAITCHRAQGSTVDVALVYADTALYREAGYVAMSRGRQANILYATAETLDHDVGCGPTTHAEASDLDAMLTERLTRSRAQSLASDAAHTRGRHEDELLHRLPPARAAGYGLSR